MPVVLCPHCGAQTFTIEGWADLDTCSECGRPLAKRDPRRIEMEVRERLYGGLASPTRPPRVRTKPTGR